MARARNPAKSLRSSEHRALCALLTEAREQAGLSQTELARRLGKPQSFISKYEDSERRLDLIEFIGIAQAIGAEPGSLFRQFVRRTAR